MRFKFFLTVDEAGQPDVIFITDMWVGRKFRSRARFHAWRDHIETQAAEPNSGVHQLGEGRFLLEGPLP